MKELTCSQCPQVVTDIPVHFLLNDAFCGFVQVGVQYFLQLQVFGSKRGVWKMPQSSRPLARDCAERAEGMRGDQYSAMRQSATGISVKRRNEQVNPAQSAPSSNYATSKFPGTLPCTTDLIREKMLVTKAKIAQRYNSS